MYSTRYANSERDRQQLSSKIRNFPDLIKSVIGLEVRAPCAVLLWKTYAHPTHHLRPRGGNQIYPTGGGNQIYPTGGGNQIYPTGGRNQIYPTWGGNQIYPTRGRNQICPTSMEYVPNTFKDESVIFLLVENSFGCFG